MTSLLSIKSPFLHSTAPLHGVKKCNYEQHVTQSKFLQWHRVPEDTIPDISCLYGVCLTEHIGNACKGASPFQHGSNVRYCIWRYSDHNRVVAFLSPPSEERTVMVSTTDPPAGTTAPLPSPAPANRGPFPESGSQQV